MMPSPTLTDVTLFIADFKTRRQIRQLFKGISDIVSIEEDKDIQAIAIVHDDAWFEPGQVTIRNIKSFESAPDNGLKITDEFLTYLTNADQCRIRISH